MANLSSADLRLRHDAAIEAQIAAEKALDQVRMAGVLADEEGSAQEAQAQAVAERARATTERLAGALEQLQLAEASERRRLAAADRDAQNAKTLAVAESLEKAAKSFDRAAEAYATSFARLLEAARSTQIEITQRRDVLRHDLAVPALEGLISSYLFKLSPAGDRQVPGAKLVGLIHDPAKVPSVADVLASLTQAIRADIDAIRAPAPQAW